MFSLRFKLIGITLIIISAGIHTGARDYKLTYGTSGTDVKISTESEDKWTAIHGADVYGVSLKDSGECMLWTNDKQVAHGNLKAGKLKLLKEDGSGYCELKFKESKIKLYLPGETLAYEIKNKENKVKVVWSEVEYGQVKYYPDTKKLKAKNSSRETVATIKNAEKLTTAPAPFLIPVLKSAQQLHLMLILYALDK